ncbi:MAG: prenyltransferase/squalene oxidase repeat-containing protein [Pirellulaceae bacterium]
MNIATPIDRRHWLRVVTALPASYFILRTASGQNSVQTAGLINEDALAAIHKGLKYLADRQNREGSFGAAGYARDVGVVSLAGLAFLASGSLPSRGPWGSLIDRLLDYVLNSCSASGFVSVDAADSHGPMYGHGFATTFLAEVYGMVRRPDLRAKLSKAVQLIVDSQNDQGGWRYQPLRQDADLSVTVCQMMALRAARNCGIVFDSQVMDRAVEYVKRCQNPDGGFMYQLPSGDSQFARSAAGAVALTSAGVYDGKEWSNAIAFLRQFQPKPDADSEMPYFFYGHYYAALAMWMAGGPLWQNWFPAIRDNLLGLQRKDGSWYSHTVNSAEYATAMSLLVLQLPRGVLPILQR